MHSVPFSLKRVGKFVMIFDKSSESCDSEAAINIDREKKNDKKIRNSLQ